MKAVYWKRVAIAAITLVFGIQVVGCGKTEETTTASKEFVFVPEYQDINMEGGIWNVEIVGDTIFFLTDVVDETTGNGKQYIGTLKAGEKEPVLKEIAIDENSNIVTLTTDTEGNLISIVNTSIFEENEQKAEAVPVEDISEKETEPDVDDSTEDQTVSEEEGQSALEEENTAAESEQVSEETTSSTVVLSDGTGGASSVAYIGGYEGEDAMPVSQKVEICKLSLEGEVLSSIDVTETLSDNSYIQYLKTDKDGNIYLGTDQKVKVLNKEGKELFEISVDNWINSMFSSKEGDVYISFYGAEQMEFHKIDVSQKKIGENIPGITTGSWGNYIFTKGADTDLLFSMDSELYTFNFEDQQPEKLLNWIDCDINSDDLSAFAVLEDGRILAITSSWNGTDEKSNVEIVYLTKKKGSEVPEKKILTLGTLSLGYDTRKEVIDFNKKSQNSRIEIKEYLTDYSADDAYSVAVEQMNTDVISGKGPDIIDLSTNNLRQYSSKGILEDIYPYIDEDPELNREDYLENVLRAYENDGKLYVLPSRISINTTMAKVADVGEKNSITLDEVIELMDRQPEGTSLYEYATKSSVLIVNTIMNMDQYVNWDTGECNFNTDNFIKTLEFANRFDKDFSYDADAPGTATLIREGKLLFLQTNISSVQEYQSYVAMFGEPVSFIGYPTTAENGSCLQAAGSSLLSINAKSNYKDEAWQFIRTGLTKEEQEKNTGINHNGFPIMKSALEKQFEKDMQEEYYETPDGDKEKQPKTTWGYDNFSVEIYAATEEEINGIRELIESTERTYDYDEKIYKIIEEETQSYFEGQKSPKDVADIIQNRIQIYVSESR